jgi:transformation/transcription domain-associated protein
VLQIMELQEAAQIHQALQHGRSNSLHDMKATIKTWRNRLPVIADDLSHWSDIFTWRQHHYTFIASHFNAQHDQTVNSTLGVHASAQVSWPLAVVQLRLAMQRFTAQEPACIG